MNIDRWLSLPSSLRLGKPDPDDYDDDDSYTDAFKAWIKNVEEYDVACDRAADETKERRYEQD